MEIYHYFEKFESLNHINWYIQVIENVLSKRFSPKQYKQTSSKDELIVKCHIFQSNKWFKIAFQKIPKTILPDFKSEILWSGHYLKIICGNMLPFIV